MVVVITSYMYIVIVTEYGKPNIYVTKIIDLDFHIRVNIFHFSSNFNELGPHCCYIQSLPILFHTQKNAAPLFTNSTNHVKTLFTTKEHPTFLQVCVFHHIAPLLALPCALCNIALHPAKTICRIPWVPWFHGPCGSVCGSSEYRPEPAVYIGHFNVLQINWLLCARSVSSPFLPQY